MKNHRLLMLGLCMLGAATTATAELTDGVDARVAVITADMKGLPAQSGFQLVALKQSSDQNCAGGGTPEQRSACRSDAMSLCGAYILQAMQGNYCPISRCMESNYQKLSQACKDASPKR